MSKEQNMKKLSSHPTPRKYTVTIEEQIVQEFPVRLMTFPMRWKQPKLPTSKGNWWYSPQHLLPA